MRKFLLIPILILFCQLLVQAQDEALLNSKTIPESLLEDSNAVVRSNDLVITIDRYDKIEIQTERIVTILNKRGLRMMQAGEPYDLYSEIEKIEAFIYDENGNRIAKFKKSDFNDESAVPSGTLYSDNRALYLEYTPSRYPFTLVYRSTVKKSSTAFLPSWFPQESYQTSIESSKLSVINNTDVQLKVKESNLENYNITKPSQYNYMASNLKAIDYESYSPGLSSFAPQVKIALTKFKMEGVSGVNEDWQGFGKWMNDNLFQEITNLPENVKQQIQSLTKDAQSDREKAKIVYEFMQDRSRYISVQVGIGGWQPAPANEVHNLAYGDCKGLSNYTKALLNEVGIPAYHAVIYGGRNIRNVDASFSSTQGNHMILYIPSLDEEKDVWLECTSKHSPFGYIAGFTDDRDALVVTEEGGVIKHTSVYKTDDNLQTTTASIQLFKNGSATASLSIETSGYQYSFKEDLVRESAVNLKKMYSNYWSHLNGLNVVKSTIDVDKEDIKVNENIDVTVDKYASKTGDYLLFQPVVFNRNESQPPKYKNRKADFEIDRGYVDIDEYIIELEEGLTVDTLPEVYNEETKFGTYQLKVTAVDSNKLKVYRYLKINNGYFPKEDYKLYREFRGKLVKYDRSKIALKKI